MENDDGGSNEQKSSGDAVEKLAKIYDSSSLRPPLSVAEIGRDVLGLHHIYGYDSSRKGNLHFIEDDRIIFVDGSTVVLEHIHDGSREFLLHVSECGAACVAVHPSKKYFAVGGRGYHPVISIYSYPDLKIRCVLRGGAELGYSCMDFSSDGEMLATVSTSPDFMLTIWDWKDEKMGLHSKAFGQDVWNVKFSKDDGKRLTTSGIGHIRFWKMASTFTGLKLQGHIGKFGKIDLSDVESFVELPDGKVLSGTEVGSLLLWEVTYVGFDRQEQAVITASSDGQIKWWDFTSIDTAEVDSDHSSAISIRILPSAPGSGPQDMKVVQVVNQAKNNHMAATDFEVVVQEDSSSRGSDFVIETKVFGAFHAGRIVGLDCSPVCNWIATCGVDGKVYVTNAESRLDPRGSSFAVGFGDGSMRILAIELDSNSTPFLARKAVIKPHNGSISCISFSPDESYVASAGRDGSVFFFKCKASNGEETISIEPIRFINVSGMAQAAPGSLVFCSQIDWSNSSSHVLLSCSDKVVREVDISELYELGFVDNKDALTFEITLPYRSITPIVDVIAGKNGVMKVYQAPQFSAEGKTDGPDGGSAETPQSPTKSFKVKDDSEPLKCITKVGSLLYSANRAERGYFGSLSLTSSQYLLCEINRDDTNKFKELNMGLYAPDGKEFRKVPEPREVAYSKSKRFVTVSLSDGTIQVQ
eukprot:gene1665-1214_t